jgi:hypothetical protein
VLSIGTVIYLACLPLGWWSQQRYSQADAALAATPAAGDDRRAHPREVEEQHERPARLN